jgi:NitT/TauT family transport system substrate-binding protein
MGTNSWTGDGNIGGGHHRLSRRSFLGGAAGVTGVLLAGCGGGSGGSGGSGVEDATFLTIIPLNLGFISELLGDINGHFAKEGLKVTIQSTRGSAPALQAILQGSALCSRVGAIETVQHNAQAGSPLVNIGTQWRKSPLGFVSSPKAPLRNPADWRGKTMGIPSKGGTSEITFNLMLASQNIPVDSVKRQVTGFSVATYDLIDKHRIDGFVAGSVETVLFPLQKPEAVVVDPSKWVEEGQCYVTSQRQLTEKKDILQAYMNVVKVTMQEVMNDKANKYKNIIAAVRKKYDFPELKDDKVAQNILQGQVDAWTFGGEPALLKTVPQSWQKVYDQLVHAKIVEGGKNPQQWFNNELLTSSP